MKSYPLDIRKAIVCFQFSERIKSELILAAKLLVTIEGLKNDELQGAKKLMESFLDALLGEINIASNVTKQREFEEGGLKVQEAGRKISEGEFLDATKCISEAISFVTTSGQRAMQMLKREGLL